VVTFAVDLHEHFIDVPLPWRPRPKPFGLASPDFRRKHRAKSVPPEADRFVTRIDAALGQQILGIAQ